DGVEPVVEHGLGGELDGGPAGLLVDGGGDVERAEGAPLGHLERQLWGGFGGVDDAQLVGEVEGGGELGPVDERRVHGGDEQGAGGLRVLHGPPVVGGPLVGRAEPGHPQAEECFLQLAEPGREAGGGGLLDPVGEAFDPAGELVAAVLDAHRLGSPSCTRSPMIWATMACTCAWSTTPSWAAAPIDWRARPMLRSALTRVSRLEASEPSSHCSTSSEV